MDYLEAVINKFVEDGIFPRHEIDSGIEEAMKKSVPTLDKSTLAEMVLVTLENDNAVANMLGVLFMSVDQLSSLVINQAMEIEMLKQQIGGNA